MSFRHPVFVLDAKEYQARLDAEKSEKLASTEAPMVKFNSIMDATDHHERVIAYLKSGPQYSYRHLKANGYSPTLHAFDEEYYFNSAVASAGRRTSPFYSELQAVGNYTKSRDE